MDQHVEYYPTTHTRKAIALVAHGLNMKPAGMLPMAQWLNQQGMDVFLVKFSGHFQASINIRDITPDKWMNEMQHASTIAKNAATQAALPLYFVGYSMGALFGQLLMAAAEAPVFNKQILIAPATAIRRRGYLLKGLFFLNKKTMLPSFTPCGYRANRALPLAAFDILFKHEAYFFSQACPKLNIPTLVFIDPKDELVSYKKMATIVQQHQLTNYQLVRLDTSLRTRQSRFHHLVVSEQTMGTHNWEMATERMLPFLFDATP